jgi:alanine racemase
MYSLQQIAQITSSKFSGKNNYGVNVFLSDSRNLFSPDGVLFVAIKTNKNNGHQYIKDLVEKGVTSFLIHESEESSLNDLVTKNPDVSFVVSSDTLKALQTLAIHHRGQFSIPVIGITGSNGKTVVKEWLYQMLKNNYSICRSPKSFNSQLGVPLSVLNLNNTHTLAIFESGISKPGEMDALVKIIQPAIGIITSIGSAHDEGFENREQKISEKLKLVENCRKIIINGLKKGQLPVSLQNKSIIISESSDADFRISFEQNVLKMENAFQKLSFKIPFTDQASVLNTSTCIAALLQMDISILAIDEKIALLQPIALRLEIKNGINNCLVINDFYNSDLDSLKIALNFLQQQSRRKKKGIIISDIEQSGVLDHNLYKEIADLISKYKIDFIVGVGKKISGFKSFFKFDSLFFENTAGFEKEFNHISYRFSDSTILLKGARSFGFENISSLLQQKSHDTVFEINLNKLISNVNYYKLLLEPKVQLMCMVKAMGYGGGGSELANTLQHVGVNYLAVAYADEGVELRQSHINLPIMVMSPETDAYEDIINYRLEPEIYSFKELDLFIKKLDHLCISEPYPVHIKIDTGMHRLGFEEINIPELISVLKHNTQIKVQSVFSHLAGSDNPALDEFSEKQIKLFENICAEIEAGIKHKFLKHICNSGAISRFKYAHFDMVRLGIGMHGVGVNPEEQKYLENVGTLKTKISQIKNIKAGETVSYNRSGKVEKDMVIATIPIGYADGFSRALGNGRAGVYVNGNYCKTIGNICMDMCMIDITNVKCEEGNEVIIFENIEQLQSIASAIGTITYEVLTSVSGRVKRVYVQE